MSSLFKRRKYISWVLLVVMVFQFLTSSFFVRPVFAESANARLNNYLSLAKSSTINDIDISQITQEELQMLGVYLSNFYIPFSTELGNSSDDNVAKENMVKALVEGASFDEELAEVLVEAVWEMTLMSAKPLYIGNKTANGVEDVSARCERGGVLYYGLYDYALLGEKNNTTEGLCEDGHTVATYTSFLDWFSGLEFGEKDESYGDNSVSIDEYLKDKNICLFWKDDSGNKIPVFDTKFKLESSSFSGDFTASSLCYAIINDNLNYKTGIGSSLLGMKLSDYNNLQEEQKSSAVATDARLYVDCFGNILANFGIAKYVLVPACVNPYTWCGYNSTTDRSSGYVGDFINLVNLFMLNEASLKHIDIASGCNEAHNNETDPEEDTCAVKYRFGIYKGENSSLLDFDYWRVERGKKDTSLDKGGLFDLGVGKDLNSYVAKYFIHGNDQKYSFHDWSAYKKDCNSTIDGISDYGFTGWWCKHIIDDFILLDSVNQFKSKDDEKQYELFNLMNNGQGGITDANGKLLGGTASSQFNSNVNSNELNIIKTGQARAYLTGIYISYALAFYDAKKDDGTYYVSYSFSKDQYPSVSDVEINWTNLEISEDSMEQEIKSMIYYFLHPKVGIPYVVKWFKNKVSGILVGWHEDMVGSSSGTSTTGSTKYLGFSGYVTLPSLYDLEWTAWLLEEYNSIVVYLIIIIFILLITYCIVGSMTFQRAIIGTLLFGVLAFFPPLCINSTVNTVNRVCDNIYGDKFTYWALVQHESYVNDLDSAINESNFDNYLATIFNIQAEDMKSDSYTSVRLKWLSPKKINVESDATSKLNDVTQSSLLSHLVSGTMQQQLSGETFLDNEDALYLFRSYTDLYLYMKTGYGVGNDWYISGLSSLNMNIESSDIDANSSDKKLLYPSGYSLSDIFELRTQSTREYTDAFAINNGFVINTGTSDTENKRYSFLLDSTYSNKIINNNYNLINSSKKKPVLNVTDEFRDTSYGLRSSAFNTTLAKLNGGIREEIHRSGDTIVAKNYYWNTDNSSSSGKADIGSYYFSLYTESPFYYFAWNIYDQQNSSDFSSSVGNSVVNFDSMLLDMYTIDNQKYFYNYSENAGDGYGELRDFCNMRDLFYYVIPYLRACNQGMYAWSDLYGTFLYEDVKVRYENGVAINFPTSEDSDEYIYKWWHNYNVERLFNTYTPWVDLMESCEYSKAETISVLGDDFLVTDPLDPTSYFTLKDGKVIEGRPMIFSRAEMGYYGLSMKDLTVVEQKIIKIQDRVYEDLLVLADYKNFDNDVLVTAAGMLTTFAFNQEFSQINTFGTSYTLYPQSYELKAFTYDAYLRLILAESTGEDLMDTSNSTSNNDDNKGMEKRSYYQRIVENSSILTGIGLLILDLLAVYALPALKLFFLVAIFFMSILMIIASAIKLENIVKATWESLLSPLLKFLAVSIGMAWLVSLFMYEGNTEVTGRGGLTISLGDPVMVILVMIIINLATLILYYKICKKCFKDLIDFAKAVFTSISGTVAGSISKLTGHLLHGKQMTNSVARGIAKSRGKDNSPKPKVGESDNPNDSREGGKTGDSNVSTTAAGIVAGRLSSNVSAEDTAKIDEKRNRYDKKSEKLDKKADKSAEKVDNLEQKAKDLRDYDKSGQSNLFGRKASSLENKASKSESKADKYEQKAKDVLSSSKYKDEFDSAKKRKDKLDRQKQELEKFRDNNSGMLSNKRLKKLNKDIDKAGKRSDKASKNLQKKGKKYVSDVLNVDKREKRAARLKDKANKHTDKALSRLESADKYKAKSQAFNNKRADRLQAKAKKEEAKFYDKLAGSELNKLKADQKRERDEDRSEFVKKSIDVANSGKRAVKKGAKAGVKYGGRVLKTGAKALKNGAKHLAKSRANKK